MWRMMVDTQKYFDAARKLAEPALDPPEPKEPEPERDYDFENEVREDR